MKSLLATALISAALLAAPAAGLAQVSYGDGGADPDAPTAYAGVSASAFYSVDQRISDLQQRISTLGGRVRGQAMAALNGVKAFEAMQRSRHNGELRDWDREAINTRLDRLAARYGLG